MTQPIRPMLGEIELQQAQLIQLDEDQVLTRHDIPALEGDFFQQLGRAGAAIELTGIQSGPEARDGLTGLRDAFRAAAPLTFAADIVTATELDDVLIERFEISEHAGLPDCYEYRLRLREYTEAPEPEPETPPPEIEPPQVTEDEGVLIVNVVKEDDPGFDASGVTVTVSGTTQDGQEIRDRPLTDRDGNRWTEDPFPAGSFTVLANAPGAAADGGDLSGTEPATVRAGETTEVTVTLRDEAALALRFIVHFRFDSAFVEPCLLQVLRQAAGFSAENADMRLLTVGHTDLAGTPEYNQSLSERRARSVFAVLRFANDPAAAVAEWNELRQTRTPGTTRSLRDTWGTREYQQMLQERGFYQGRIDGDHGPLTDTAVREFQDANGLPATGAMNGATWPVLIEAYLAGENLSIADDRLLPNCPGEGLKWLGCGELDPVRNVTFAWRPNRRTELLFTRATELPADVAQPDTFNLPSPGSVAGGWCVNDSSTTTRCCFVEPNPASVRHETCPGTLPRGEPLTRQPVEPAPQFVVQGSIRFEDGTPYTGEFFVTAPDGEYMPDEVPSTSGSVRAGTPVRARPEPDGSFSFPTDPATGNPRLKSPGIFILELDADVVARPSGAPLEDAKGPVVCKRLAGPADRFDVVIVSRQVAEFVPEIIAPDAVVVRRPHTNPARQPVILRVNAPFTGTGTLTISQGAGRIRIFDAPAAGNELTFDGTDNVFTSDQLVAGHTVFVEGGPDPSLASNDVELALQLDVNGEPGFTDREQMTSVRLTLDAALSRPTGGGAPPFLSEADKIATGRFTQVADPNFSHERTMLRINAPEPSDFTGDLILTPIGSSAAAFSAETAQSGQVALANPHPITGGPFPQTLFAEGLDHSAALRDSGFMLGLRNIEPDGDRVMMTMVRLDIAPDATPATATASVARFGVWDQAYDGAGNLVADFIANDERRLHFRIRDRGAGTGPVTVNWRTLRADQSTNDDAPASTELTLPESSGGSRHFISRGVMLVTDDTDVAVDTQSGLPADPGRTEPRNRGQSNHRLRRARIDGFVRAEYTPAQQPGVRLPITIPVFPRNPDERRRLSVRVIRYTSTVAGYVNTPQARIDAQFVDANHRWNQVGLQVDAQATEDRPIPAGALDGNVYGGSANNAFEQAALIDLIPIVADNTLTVVFTEVGGAQAYATVALRNPIPNPAGGPDLTLGDRFFIFVDTTDAALTDTLAHELHHVLFNRFDAAVDDQFISFNTNNPNDITARRGLTFPDVRILRRIQNQHSADPDNDPPNDNILNWVRRARTRRHDAAGNSDAGPGPAPNAQTGNTLVGNF